MLVGTSRRAGERGQIGVDAQEEGQGVVRVAGDDEFARGGAGCAERVRIVRDLADDVADAWV